MSPSINIQWCGTYIVIALIHRYVQVVGLGTTHKRYPGGQDTYISTLFIFSLLLMNNSNPYVSMCVCIYIFMRLCQWYLLKPIMTIVSYILHYTIIYLVYRILFAYLFAKGILIKHFLINYYVIYMAQYISYIIFNNQIHPYVHTRANVYHCVCVLLVYMYE